MREGRERTRVQPVGERIIHQVRRHQQEPRIVHVAQPIALQRTEIIRVAELGAERLEDRPVAVAAAGAELAREMIAQIALHAIVVEQRVVAID